MALVPVCRVRSARGVPSRRRRGSDPRVRLCRESVLSRCSVREYFPYCLKARLRRAARRWRAGTPALRACGLAPGPSAHPHPCGGHDEGRPSHQTQTPTRSATEHRPRS